MQARLERLHPKIIDLSLGRISRLLTALGHPERRLPPVIHITGTNGKGSTLALLRGLFEVAGKRVHTYSSPHLVRFNERIELAGRQIEDEELLALLDRCEAANDGQSITFFEMTTAMALLAYAETPADVLLLEVGLGGLYDATNVIDQPEAAVIAPVSLDHRDFLGDSLAGIAREKAGILKPGRPGVIGPQVPEAAAAITDVAASIGAPLHRHGIEWGWSLKGNGLRFEGQRLQLDLPAPALNGRHQLTNAATALAVIDACPSFGLPADGLGAGLQRAHWPARLQRLRRGPLFEALPDGWRLWLDGGHNAAAGQILADWIAARPEPRPIDLIVGMVGTKDYAAFLKPILPHIRRLAAVPVPRSSHPLEPDRLVEAAREQGAQAVTAADPQDAAARLAGQSDSPADLLICGSLYLAGSLLDRNS